MGKRLAALFFGLSVALFSAEFFFRAAIAVNSPFFKNPALYADFYTDDNYWKLNFCWKTGKLVWIPPNLHPLLGWTQAPVSPENPMGLQKDTFDRLNMDGRKKILFYGDSFIKGRASEDFELPRYLNRKIPGKDVLDLGMGGFGADQIYLMFRETHEKAVKPVVLVGMLVEDDMDRTILKFRSGPKPYFVAEKDGTLALKGIPVNLSVSDYLKESPPRIYSYLYQFLRMKFFKDDRRREKQIITSQLIGWIQESCKKQGASLAYVLFYGKNFFKTKGYQGAGWKEDFLKSELTRRGIDFIDIKPAIAKYLAENGGDVMPLYFPDDGHHSDLGNQVVGDEIFRYLKAKGYAE